VTSTGPWGRARTRFRARRTNLAASGILGILAGIALFADLLASDLPLLLKYDGRVWILPNVIDYAPLRGLDNRSLRVEMTTDEWAIFPPCEFGPTSIAPLSEEVRPLPQVPSRDHLLGTDATGRDTLARLIHGTRLSLSIGVVAVSIYLFIGLLLGLLAGWFGGAVDWVVTRVNEILLNFPLFFLLLAIQGVLEKTSVWSTMVVIGLTRWTDPCRLVRAETLRVKRLDFVTAARALGASDLRILATHVLPNVIQPLFVTASFGVASAVLVETALSFLGFGAPEPTPSWGLLMADGFETILSPGARLLVLLPGLAIFVTVTAFNLAGEGLRDALDPGG